jgi:hypothetical protein
VVDADRKVDEWRIPKYLEKPERQQSKLQKEPEIRKNTGMRNSQRVDYVRKTTKHRKEPELPKHQKEPELPKHRKRRDGRMFILDRTGDGPDTALFAEGQRAESDIDLWHKRIGHVNYQRLQDLQKRQVVLGLPKFSSRKAQICEAYQLGKQH